MHTITKSFTFDMAHRLINYIGPCANLHGHTYTAIIQYSANNLDSQGFVIDFAEITKNIKSWVDKTWDHGVMLHKDDPLVEVVKPHTSKIYIMPCNPSAENIARELYSATDLLINTRGKNFTIVSVAIKETPTSEAYYCE